MVFLDASAIIYLLEGDAPTQAAARETLGRLRTKDFINIPHLTVYRIELPR